ncbi:MAG TPA: cytochrome b5 domain-containing protein [Spirochaetia bacterium]|nr:cytochrome b5 domain-containing protein [Spirochaetia bacterium]
MHNEPRDNGPDSQLPSDGRGSTGHKAARSSPGGGPRSQGSRAFTEEELAHYDGREGRPAYVAYRGLVFDVSGSMRWAGGRHQDRHDAGRDLTEELKEAPHGTTILLRVPIVGRLRK